MSRKVEVRDLETVDGLIQAEIEEGLARFRAGGAAAQLRARIAGSPGPSRRRPFRAWAAVPVLLTATAAVAVLVVVTRPPAGRPIDARDFAAVLLRSPSLARLSAEASPSPRPRTAEGGFEKALAGTGRSGGASEPMPPADGGLAQAPALSLSERMRILYKDKVIERALMLLISKSKEA